MAKQRVVNTYFWSDDFILDLKADEKLMFLYVLTNPQTDLCGAYEIAMRKIVFETKLTERRVIAILEKFEAAGKVCYRNGWMIVRNFAKHQVNNPKVSRGVERSLNACPDWVKEIVKIGFDRLSPKTTLLLLPEPQPEPQPSGKALSAEAANVGVIFTYWQAVHGKEKFTLTRERENAVKARLKKYTVDQIMRAIDGCKKSPHHQGENDTGTVYDDLELICRSDTKLEQFIGYNERKENQNGINKNQSARDKQSDQVARSISREEELMAIGLTKREESARRSLLVGGDADHSADNRTGEPTALIG